MEVHEEFIAFPNVNRLEVIDHTNSVEDGGGRAYVYWRDKAPRIKLVTQDEGRTLKIFIEDLTD